MRSPFSADVAAAFLGGAVIFSLAGCGGGADESPGREPARVSTAEPAERAEKPQAAAPERYQPGLQQLDTGVDLSRASVKAADSSSAESGSAETGPAEPRPDAALAPNPGSLDASAIQAQAAPEPPQGAGENAVLDPLQAVNRSLEMKGGLSLVDGEQVTHNFGTIRQGEVREHVYSFLSNGEEPLIVRAIKPSCGCTKAEISLVSETGEVLSYEKGAEIPIGQRFQLLTEVSTDGKGPGAFAAQVSVYSNAPSSPFNLRLVAEIEPVLIIEPDHTVFLGQMTSAERKEASVTVHSKRGERFLLKLDDNALSQDKPIEVTLTPDNPDADGKSDRWQIRLAAGPNLDIGMQTAPIQLISDLPIPNPKYPNEDGAAKCFPVMLALQARVIGLVNAEPAFISFGMVRPGQTVERSVRIESHDETFQLFTGMPVQIEGLYGGEFPYSSYFATTLEPADDGRVLDLKLKLEGLPADLNGSFGGILKLAVGHPSMKELTVRFSGVCRPGSPAAAPTGGSGN